MNVRTTMKYLKIFFYYWLPVFLWAGVIFFLSSVPALKSPLPDVWDLFFRKLAHLGEYAILAILLLRLGLRQEKRNKAVLIICLLACFIYAISDEYHQSFVAERVAQWSDVLIDSLGAIIGAMIYWQGKK